MGNVDTKMNFRKAIVQLGTKNQQINANDDTFWDQFWSEHCTSIQDVFALVPSSEIRNLRKNNPANLATLCYKAVERLMRAVDSSCRTHSEQQAALNCVRLLTRIIPYIHEDTEWKDFFWSSLPSSNENETTTIPLAQSLLNAVCDLLFCPDFTVTAARRSGPDKAEELAHIDSCEYIWDAGVGFAHSPPKNSQFEQRRTELLKLLLTCFSETMYRTPSKSEEPNKWIAFFTSAENRHALPLFTSFLNTVCSYDPVGLGVPYNHFIFSDTMEPLVEACLQILIVTLDHDMTLNQSAVALAANGITTTTTMATSSRATTPNSPTAAGNATSFEEANCVGDNLFINYLSRIHRDEDFQFCLKGITRLLNNPLVQSYLPNSTKRLYCHQELLVFFWKICDYNKKFLYYVLKSSDVLDVLVPILYHLNDSRADQSRVGLMHIGVFILLLLSGERNFGVRLNKPYTATVPMDIPVFTGSHADLLITVFHKIIATGHQRLQPLFDCLLTILVNVSPYLKTLSMVAAIKLLHLLEAFSTPWFLFSAASNHHLVFFLLEIFNNIIQYQFDGNSNLVYTIIRKRHVFHALANLPSDVQGISKCLNNRKMGITAPTPAAAPPPPAQISNRSKLPQTTSPTAEKKTFNDHSSSVKTTKPSIKSNDDENHDDGGGGGSGGDINGSTPTTAAAVAVAAAVQLEPKVDGDIEELDEEPMEGSHPAQPAEPGTLKASLLDTPAISAMTERESAHLLQAPLCDFSPMNEHCDNTNVQDIQNVQEMSKLSLDNDTNDSESELSAVPPLKRTVNQRGSIRVSTNSNVNMTPVWTPTPEWVASWRAKLPLQTIMRLLQVLVPQVEKICIDKGLTDESEILKFLQHGTLVGLLPVPHPILIRKYQANSGTTAWFRTYMWGVIYLRNIDPAIWYDTEVRLFEIQRV